jgi:4-aminobutyrate aminotransferase
VLRRADGTPAEPEAEQMMYAALSLGLNFKVTMGSILTLTPPLNIEERHLDEAVAILDRCFNAL